ncbi:MAG: type II toxin-antitoxin system Phd/YefM family antitoxin [Thermomicrobiales bacterium]|nr:type II toxin-antitoxin system Phd/YefM family antitoxin [Thermomicrobiales bacterium]
MNKVPVETISFDDAQQSFDTILEELRAQNKRIVVERNGTPVAIIAPFEDLMRLRRSDEIRASRAELIENFSRPFKNVDPDELQREIDRAVEEVRAEMRAEREEARRLAS